MKFTGEAGLKGNVTTGTCVATPAFQRPVLPLWRHGGSPWICIECLGKISGSARYVRIDGQPRHWPICPEGEKK